MRAAPSYLVKNRSITAIQVSRKPATLVRIKTQAVLPPAGSSRTSRAPEPTTPTCARPDTFRAAGYSNSMRSMRVLSILICFNFVQAALDGVKKQTCGQQIGAASGRQVQLENLPV